MALMNDLLDVWDSSELKDTFEGLSDSIEFGGIIGDLSENVDYATLPVHKIDSQCFELTWVKTNGVVYKPKSTVYLGNNYSNDRVIGIITYVITTQANEIYIIYKKCMTLGLNNHKKAHEIVMPHQKVMNNLLRLNLKEYLRPMKVHVTADSCNVMARRDLR